MAWRRPGDNPLSEPMLVSIYASLGLNELIDGCVVTCYRQHWVDSDTFILETVVFIIRKRLLYENL